LFSSGGILGARMPTERFAARTSIWTTPDGGKIVFKISE
jgi:hypothetical protein